MTNGTRSGLGVLKKAIYCTARFLVEETDELRRERERRETRG